MIDTRSVVNIFLFAETKKSNAPGGTRTPDPGLIRPMVYQTELPEQVRAHARDRTKDLQIFSLTLSQLSYMGIHCVNSGNWFLYKTKSLLKALIVNICCLFLLHNYGIAIPLPAAQIQAAAAGESRCSG